MARRGGQHLVDVVHVSGELGGLAVARARHGEREVGANAAGVFAQHDDAVGQQHGLLNVVGDDEDGLGGNGLLAPELQQFAAQVLGGEHVESGEWLVHEEDFGFDDEGAGKADALLHAAGEFLGIGLLEAVEADGVENFKAAFAALEGVDAARLERGFHVFKNSEPGKKREALKDDGDVGRAIANRRLPCQRTSPAEGRVRPVSMRSSVLLPEPEGPSKARIWPGSTARSVGAMTGTVAWSCSP